MRLALLLLVLLPQSSDIRALIEKLKSDDITAREEAFKKLKELGDAAEAELQKAEKDPHAEVSSRAKKLLHLIRTRRELTPNLRFLVPGIEDRLAFGPDHEWTKALNDLLAWKDAQRLKLKRADLNCLAGRAWEFARPEEREDLRNEIEALRLRGAVPAIIRNLEVIEAFEAESLLDTFQCREAAVPRAVELLKHPEASVRSEAARLLERLEAYDSHPFVLPLLQDESRDVREAAALFFRSAERPEAAQGLRKLLDDPDEDVRWFAREALRAVAPADVLPRLLKVKEVSDPAVRGHMARLLRYYHRQEAESTVLELLMDPEGEVRASAVGTLKGWGHRSAYEVVLPLLTDDDEEVRSEAAEALLHIDRDRALPEMRKLLGHAKAGHKFTALETLAEVKDDVSIPAIAALLTHEDAELRKKSIEALVSMNAGKCAAAIAARLEKAEGHEYYLCSSALLQLKGPGAVPVLLRMLDSHDEKHIASALKMLSSLGVAESIPKFSNFLEHESPIVRGQAAAGLGRFKERSAIPGIRKLLKDEARGVQLYAIEALGEFEATEAREDLLPYLKEGKGDDPQILVRWAIRALGQLKEKKSAPDLLPFLEQDRYREAAFEALCAINDPATYPAMTKVLDDLNHWNRLMAIRGFGRLKTAAVVPPLLALLKDEEPSLRAWAVWSLGQTATPEAIQGVISALGDRRWECKDAALRALRDLGVTAAIPEVAKLLQDPSELIRLHAADTLGWLGSKEGARASLEGRKKLTGLNFLRRPGATRKLKSVRLKGPFEGTNAELLDRIAKAAGTTWKPTPAAAPRIADWLLDTDLSLESDEDMNLMQVLDDLVYRRMITVVVENEGFVLMQRNEAVALFEAWLAESK